MFLARTELSICKFLLAGFPRRDLWGPRTGSACLTGRVCFDSSYAIDLVVIEAYLAVEAVSLGAYGEFRRSVLPGGVIAAIFGATVFLMELLSGDIPRK